MKKRLLIVFVLLIGMLTLIFTACDEEEVEEPEENNFVENNDVGGTTSSTFNVTLYVTETQSYTFQSGEMLSGGLDEVRSGYNFLGIFDAPVGGSMIARPNGEILQYIDRDCTLYCQWEAKDITINLSTPIGRIDGVSTYTIKAGQPFPHFGAPLFNQNQYAFLGWKYNGNLVSDGILFNIGYDGAYDVYNLTSSIDLVASFDLAKLQVIFDNNDGSYERTEYEVSYGTEFTFDYPEITGDGREVMFWSETPSGTNPYVPDKITGNLTLYAIWDDIKTVKFYIQPGVYDEKKYYRSKDVNVEDGVRDFYEFDGWYTSENYFGNPVTTFSFGFLLKAYYAKWIPITYTINLQDEEELGNNFQREYSYTVLSDIELPKDLKKKGYRFLGFADAKGNVFSKLGKNTIGNEVLTATYEAIEYTVTFYDEKDNAEIAAANIHYKDEIPESVLEKVGYDIDCFFLSGGEEYTPSVYEYDCDMRLLVRYVAIDYTINYHLNGGRNNPNNPATFTIENSVTLDEPSKDYSIFEGWYFDGNYTREFTGIEVGTHSEVDVYAYFRGLNYRINLDPNGGDCQREYVTIPYDERYSLPICTRDDHTFIGWYTTVEGEEGEQLTDESGASLSVSAFHEISTVYARYNKRYYVSVNTDYPEAFTLQPEEFYYAGDNVRLTLQWDDGYDFLGFFENRDAEAALTYSQVYTFAMPAEDVSVFIKLTPKFFYINLNAGEGEIDKQFIIVEYGQNYELPIPRLGGKDFIGWIYGDHYLTHETGKSLSAYRYKNDIDVQAVFMDVIGATILYKVEDFNAMRNANTGSYVMAANMSLKGTDYVPFEFKGTLDGRGYVLQTDKNLFTNITGTVKNLIVDADIYVENPTTTEVVNAAILSITINGTVDNVTTRGSIHLKGRGSIGGFCYQLASGTIKNSTNEATVYGEMDLMERECGGVVAYRSGGAIKDTINKGTVTGYYRVGGVVGFVNSWSNMKNLKNEGEVNGYERVGGTIGSFEYSGSSPTIECLINEGSINGVNRVGGVFGNITADWSVGYNNGTYSLTIIELKNSGNVVGSSYVGGTVGYLYTQCTHSSSYTSYVLLSAKNFENTGDITGNNRVGGLFGYAYTNNGSSSISNGQSSGHIHAVNGLVGGIAGQLQSVSISNCTNAGTTLTLDGFILDGSSANAYLGGYVGYGSYVSGCTNATDINYTDKGRWVGGIAGYLTSGITACNNTGNISATKSTYVGGLVGEFNYSWSNPSMKNSQNSGTVSGASNVGGIFGRIYADWSVGYNNGQYNYTFDQIENSGNITASGNCVGGLYGYVSVQCTHSSSYTSYVVIYATNLSNTGDIKGNAYVGGLIGYGYTNNSSSYISNSSSFGNIHAVEYMAGGLAGQLRSIALNNCSNEGTIITLDTFHLDGANFNAYLGGYVGYGYSVSGCNNATDITYTDKGRWVGGIAGYLTTNITACSNSANIIATKSTYVGGLVGEFNYSWSNPSMKNSQNSGTVSGASNVGGIFGRIHADWGVGYNDGKYSITFDKITNSGNVTAGGSYVGGIAGHMYVQCTHSSSYTSYVIAQFTSLTNNGAIVGEDEASIGTFFGYAYTNHSGSAASLCANTGSASVNNTIVNKAVGQVANFSLTFGE